MPYKRDILKLSGGSNQFVKEVNDLKNEDLYTYATRKTKDTDNDKEQNLDLELLHYIYLVTINQNSHLNRHGMY